MTKISLNDQPARRIEKTAAGWLMDGKPVSPDVFLLDEGRRWLINLDGEEAEVFFVKLEEDVLTLKINGKKVKAKVETLAHSLLKKIGQEGSAKLKASDLKAPMPGLIRRIQVKPGDEVKKGDPILVLEAMKMENILKSPIEGVIGQVLAVENTAVDKNAILVKFA